MNDLLLVLSSQRFSLISGIIVYSTFVSLTIEAYASLTARGERLYKVTRKVNVLLFILFSIIIGVRILSLLQ